MKRIFLEDVSGAEVTISGNDANHLARSLRARRGDKITAVDGAGNCAVLELIDFDKEKIKARRVSDIRQIVAEKKIILADCLPKQNRFDNIIEKATELGVEKIEPLISERTIARPGGQRTQSKLERWRRIAKESAEQCARDTIPEIENICELDEWLKKITPLDEDTFLLFCWEGEQDTTVREVLSVNKDKNIIVLIGPEGGFSEREVFAIKAAGGISVTLGKRILKTDTAAISVLAMINYERM
ncbi:MAG: 16S rRNA (uracil(1498)-N(3))-methyltransferase [Selenomonadaceae bacterium]|nr:16S rRNA (uracil(1498)-N(3))-methyltransferase [Selenomonadaceae bacterium]